MTFLQVLSCGLATAGFLLYAYMLSGASTWRLVAAVFIGFAAIALMAHNLQPIADWLELEDAAAAIGVHHG